MRWHDIATCAMCTAKWPMVRLFTRRFGVYIRQIFDPVRSPKSGTHPSLRKMTQDFNVAKWMLLGIVMRFIITCVWRRSGDLIIADCEEHENQSASGIHIKQFKHEEVAQEGSFTLFDLPQHPRGEMLAKEKPRAR